ncbi:MAG TPA: GatB/YqeY domain-containing protein [Acidobacteriaceae bacterium]
MSNGLVKQIDVDVVAAMKARDALKLETLRMVKAALKNKEIEKREALTEPEAQAVLTTLIKQRRDSIEQFTKGGRPELAAKEAGEIEWIESYLPKAAGAGELQGLVAGVVEQLTASGEHLGPKEMGLVMKAVQERIRELGLRAEGRQVSELVKAALAK